jgi:hypothetical protein
MQARYASFLRKPRVYFKKYKQEDTKKPVKNIFLTGRYQNYFLTTTKSIFLKKLFEVLPPGYR